MKLLKVSILLIGAAGLVLVLKDPGALQAGFEQAPLHSGLIVLGWALPAVMGAIALIRPPLRSWQAAASLAGFAVVAIRTRIWQTISEVADAPLDGRLGLAALVLGLVASVLAVARPEVG